MTQPIVLDRLITRLIPDVVDDPNEPAETGYPFPSFVGPLDLSEPTYTRRKVWAGRRDLRVRETLQVDNLGTVDVANVVYRVRHESDWRGGSLFEDDGGQYRVIGVAEVGRRHYLELLCEVVR